MGSGEVHKRGGGCGGLAWNGEDGPLPATISWTTLPQMRERRWYRDGGVGATVRERGIKGGGGWGERGG